ncbi:MAG TPA: hypothetical protein VGM48_14465 [Puia sp.]|jgi:hypothetical protein
MQPAEKGRHCMACQKTVVDFTGMNDGDILRHLKRVRAHRPDTQICGRFMPDQLNRQLIPPPPPRPTPTLYCRIDGPIEHKKDPPRQRGFFLFMYLYTLSPLFRLTNLK